MTEAPAGLREEWAGRRVLVVGLGASGYAAACALVDLGAKVEVTESAAGPPLAERAERLRRAGAKVTIGGHDLEGTHAELAIVSPGIPLQAPVIRALERSGVTIWSEVELAWRMARCDFLAVTGTNGKTTTTGWLAAMLEAGGIPSAAAGNIGRPLVEAVRTVPEGGAIAVELSSFQLARTVELRPRVAVMLNVAQDHTDWHGSFEDYAAAKARLIANQTADDVFLPNHADERAMAIAHGAAPRVVPFSAVTMPAGGIGVEGTSVNFEGLEVFDVSDVAIPGRAALEDAIAAAGAALCYGVARDSVAGAVRSLVPPPHRLEIVGEAEGVTYIDDSKATNPHATLTAVQGFEEVVLIAGGRSKGNDLSVLRSAVPPVVAVVAMGEAAGEIEDAFGGLVPTMRATDMDAAVGIARRQSGPGRSVLLSPGCASLDMYSSYAERGRRFKSAVRALIESEEGMQG